MQLPSTKSIGLRVGAALLVGAFSFVSPSAAAGPPEPAGPHPRLFLDAKTLASIKALASKEGSAVARAIKECERVGSNLKAEARNVYMGFEWSAHASSCAIAYHATGKTAYATTALHFFSALLDDWETVGDGKGGDTAARHDSGYAIRAFGVYGAIVYDLLHDAPGMTPALLAKARQRFKAWLEWYEKSGYHPHKVGANYQAGYLFAATMIAIAQGGEAGADGTKLWRQVADQMWDKEMRAGASRGGVLEGGDWGEGWQYGPLSVASYSLAARAMIQHGMQLPEFERWTEEIVQRHVHALSPSEKMTFALGDTEADTAGIRPTRWTLAGVLAGPISDAAAGWARAEIDRLQLPSDSKSFLLFDVLADAKGAEPTPFPRTATPTFHLARGTNTLYARSSWSSSAAWMAMQCTSSKFDHLPPKAGNLVLTRGSDDLLVDPSPYGTLGTLTSNAPTVEDGQLPAEYKPSQGWWGEKTDFTWARQTESAIVAARCDYADQYKFQEKPSDVPLAIRDVVMIPTGGGNAIVVVADRARTGAPARALHLRFRTPAALTLEGKTARGVVGASSLTIAPMLETSGAPLVRTMGKGDCFGKDYTRGNCAAARFPVNDYLLTVAGEEATAIHVLDIAGTKDALTTARTTTAPDHRVISFDRGKRHASLVLATREQPALTYRAPPGHHVVLDAPGTKSGHATVTAARDGTSCVVTVKSAASGGMDARPLVLALSETCAVAEDPTQTHPAPVSLDGVTFPVADAEAPPPAPAPPPPAIAPARYSRGGCGCEAPRGAPASGAGLALAGFALAVSVRRARRSRR